METASMVYRPLNLVYCNSIFMIFINDRKSYITTTSCLLNHVLTTTQLNSSEKLYYLIADLYAHFNKSINNSPRETEKSAQEWAKLLNRSEQHIFKMQKKLEQLDYFQIIREKDEDNQNEKNIIIPSLPDHVFNELIKEPNRLGAEHLSFTLNDHEGSKRSYLDDSKLFIKFNLPMLKMVLSDKFLSSLQKLLWIYCFYRSYISYQDQNGEGTRNFITSYQELSTIFSCKECTISIAINGLEELGFITKKQFRIKEQNKVGRRKKKSCWECCALIPQTYVEHLIKQPDRQNLVPLGLDDLKLYGSQKLIPNILQTSQLETPNSCSIQNDPNGSYSQNKSININNTSQLEAKNNTALINTINESGLYSNLQPKTSNSFNCYKIEGDPYEMQQFNNKYNILNIKNNDQIFSEITDKTILNQDLSNVFFIKELTITDQEIAIGLRIAKDFNTKVFKLTNETPYPEAVKQADFELTNEEHWLVTKTAYTLQQKLNLAVKSQYGDQSSINELAKIKLKESLFTEPEQRLIDLWDSLANLPAHMVANEEFLLRVSWLLKLLLTNNAGNVITKPEVQSMYQLDPGKKKLLIDTAFLLGDKADKAIKFASKLKSKQIAQGYAAQISTEELAKEFIYHAVNWVPERLNCKTREEQIDAALSFAWKAVEQGKWKCPYQMLNAAIVQREQEAAKWKNY